MVTRIVDFKGEVIKMKYRQIIISLLIGLILGLSTNAFAAVGNTVQAVYAQFSYVVNGVSQPPGVTALVYDGTSYLRTTDLGIMLGYNVTYRADSRTIEFNNPSATPAPSIVPIPSTSLSVTPAPTGATPSPTPAPTPDPVTGIVPTPVPNAATPVPSVAPTATPGPSATPAPTVEPTPAPTPWNYYSSPENLAACRANYMDPVFVADHHC